MPDTKTKPRGPGGPFKCPACGLVHFGACREPDPITFKDFDIQLTVSIVVKGSDYFPSDWDHDEEAFRKQMVKEATAEMRNVNFDIADCWLDHIEEVTPSE